MARRCACSPKSLVKRRAKQVLGLASVDDALTGLVVALQRTDGALRLNTHLHVLGLDGVYVETGDGELEFHALVTPSSAEVAGIARRTALRLHRAFQKQGRHSPWDEHRLDDSADSDPFSLDQPGLFACYQAAAAGVAVSGERAGQPGLRLVVGTDPGGMARSQDDQRGSEPVAEALGDTCPSRI